MDFRYYFSRFVRRLPWFMVVATLISGIAITAALTLPPAYESQLRLIVESQQIPDELARATVRTPAEEQLQIMEQRLLTRENLLSIATEQQVLRGQSSMSPDEIVQAMRAHTRIITRAGRNQATVMTVTFEAPTPQAAARVLNSYLSLILEDDAQFRTERAVTTLQFFEQQVEQLSRQLDEKSAQVLAFKNANADALPETMSFRMSEQSSLQERLARVEFEISSLQGQREQLIRLARANAQIAASGDVQGQRGTPREQRLLQLETQLAELASVYAAQSPQVVQMQARVDAARQAVIEERQIATDMIAEGEAAEGQPELNDPMLDVQLADMDNRIEALTLQRTELQAMISELAASLARTPSNAIALDGLERDLENIQSQYNRAVERLATASTGERIESMSQGQRITVVEPPAVPTTPTKPDRVKLAGGGILLGIMAGLALIYVLEVMSNTIKRPEDIVQRFEVMPIASIPYIRTRGQMLRERLVKILILMVILIGIPAAIYAVHIYYLPVDALADKIMNKLGVRW